MSAVICPIFGRLRQDMQRLGFGPAEPASVTDLREARIRREREASERKYRERYGDDFTPPEAA